MPATYEPIATTTLGSAASAITFSSISSAYTDLRVILVPTAASSDAATIQFNNDTATNYSWTQLFGNGTSAVTSRQTSQTYISTISTGTTPVVSIIDIFSYAGSTNKTVLINSASDTNGAGSILVRVGLWRSTSAINQVKINAFSVNFASGTTATLYGILKA